MALVNVSKEVPATAIASMSNLTCYYTVPTTSPPTLFVPLACAICFALFFFPVLGRGERREIATYHLSRHTRPPNQINTGPKSLYPAPLESVFVVVCVLLIFWFVFLFFCCFSASLILSCFSCKRRKIHCQGKDIEYFFLRRDQQYNN